MVHFENKKLLYTTQQIIYYLSEIKRLRSRVFLLPLEVVLVAARAQRGLFAFVEVADGRLVAALAFDACRSATARLRHALQVHVGYDVRATAERVQHLHVAIALHARLVRARAGSHLLAVGREATGGRVERLERRLGHRPLNVRLIMSGRRHTILSFHLSSVDYIHEYISNDYLYCMPKKLPVY